MKKCNRHLYTIKYIVLSIIFMHAVTAVCNALPRGVGRGVRSFGSTRYGTDLLDRNGIGSDLNKMMHRAPRPDALSYSGSTPQIVSPFDSGTLAEIKECICQLRGLQEACCSSTEELITSVADDILTILINIENSIGALSNIDQLFSDIALIASQIENINFSSVIEVIDIVASKLDIDIALDETILSKVCKIDTQLDTVESLVETVVQQGCGSSTAIILSDIDSLATTVEATSSVVNNIYNTDQTILSKVMVVDTRTNSIYSVDQAISSKVDIDIALDKTILSKVMVINTQLDTVESLVETVVQQGCGSSTAIILSDIDSLATTVEATSSVVNNIYNTDQTILSKVMVVDTRTNSIYSVDQAISSKVDIDIALDKTILSKVMVIDTRTQSIYNLDQTIDSKIDVLQTGIDTIELQLQALTASQLDEFVATFTLLLQISTGLVSTLEGAASLSDIIYGNLSASEVLLETVIDELNTINSKVDVIESLVATDLAIDSTTLSKVMVIDTRTNSIYSLDQVISSQIAALAAASSASGIAGIQSQINALSNTDQTILSYVQDIDTRVITIQSEVNVLDTRTNSMYSIDQAISSKIDVDLAIDSTTLSKVMVIDTRTNSIYSLDQVISSQIAALAAASSASGIAGIQSQINALANTDQTILSYVVNLNADLSLLPVIDSKCSNILYDVGSRSDFAHSQTDQISTIEQINDLNLTVIAWLKTIMADLHGL